MNERDEVLISQIRKDRPWVVATAAPTHPTLRLVSLVYVLAGLTHLWLADAWQMNWLPGNICFGLGLALLLWRPAAAGWTLCALGKLLPLLFGRDHLTQSVILMAFAGGGAYFVGLHAYLSTWPDRLPKIAGDDRKPSAPLAAFFEFLGLVTIATYGLAAFHKLNRDFFDPAYTCAVYGVDKLADYFAVALPSLQPAISLGLASLIVATEAGIATLYLAKQRRAALVLAVAFHIPLTLTMAPAFAFVMLAGHAAFLRPADLAVMGRFIKARGLWVAVAATALSAASMTFHGGPAFDDWTMAPREWLLWALLLIALFARPWRPNQDQQPRAKRGIDTRRLVAWAMAALFVLFGLIPYLGLRFQNTGAMLSNLRIDRGCWNHLIVPEKMRLRDDYIRVDDVYLGALGRLEKYETIATDQLWNGPMIRQMRANWCRDETRPFYLAGTYRQRPFEIDDLCAADLDWPFADDGIFGISLFDNHLRFQRNLARQCPQTCVH